MEREKKPPTQLVRRICLLVSLAQAGEMGSVFYATSRLYCSFLSLRLPQGAWYLLVIAGWNSRHSAKHILTTLAANTDVL